MPFRNVSTAIRLYLAYQLMRTIAIQPNNRQPLDRRRRTFHASHLIGSTLRFAEIPLASRGWVKDDHQGHLARIV